MPITLIVQLLTTFGPSAVSLIDKLVVKWETGGTVTAAEWSEIRTLALQSARDRMTAMLAKSGIDPASPQGVALLAAAS
ncbi:MAG TPA: hypothetical protein VLK33_23250 [Terriglobales bacterium]|nr:hypothetical protein [Terriglobales bacterium]